MSKVIVGELLDLVSDFVLMSGRSITASGNVMKKDCTDLIRWIALLIHLILKEHSRKDFSKKQSLDIENPAGALSNLCIYKGNEGRAFRAGILKPSFNIIPLSTSSTPFTCNQRQIYVD